MVLQLDNITQGFPGMTRHMGQFLWEACIVCLSRHHHSCRGTPLSILGDVKKTIDIVWADVFDDQMDRSWKDQEEATEYGAACLSILIMLENTPYTLIERSARGTGVDYWLGHKEDFLILRKARLEVSGIFQGADKMDARFRAKMKQVEQSNTSGLPAYLCVVEFGTPMAKFGEMK